MAQLIIFDWDHTLAVPESGETFRRPGEKYKWIEGEGLHSSRCELLEWLHSEGADLAIATNQGGIAFNIVRMDETQDAIFALLKDLSFFVPFLVCPYHEKYPSSYSTFCHWRKPLPGMLQALHALYPNILADEVLVVGDRDEDKGAAQNAGFAYQDAEEFFFAIERDLEAFISAEQNADEYFGPPPTGEPPDEFERMMSDGDDEAEDEPPF